MDEDSDHASDRIQIDDNIAMLVATLNSLAGIATNSSCGGHENPKPGQSDVGEWYVDFDVLPHQLAWQSLELIAFAIGELLGHEGETKLTVWHDGGLRFDLHGYGSDPSQLAKTIQDHAN